MHSLCRQHFPQYSILIPNYDNFPFFSSYGKGNSIGKQVRGSDHKWEFDLNITIGSDRSLLALNIVSIFRSDDDDDDEWILTS